MHDLPHIISLHITARLNNHGEKKKNKLKNVQSAARLASARDVIRPRASDKIEQKTTQIPMRHIL